MVLANLIGGFVTILVGVTLMPTVADQVQLATGNGSSESTNLSAAPIAILDLVTVFFALGIMAAGVAIAVTGLREAGLV